jgi:S-DNA-T family DNA segregation ATPase FtsK/SpoIIIE
MQLAWMLPSMLFGLVFAASTGTWHFALLSLASPLVWLISRRISALRQVDESAAVLFEPGSVSIGDYQLPTRQIFWKREWNERVYAAYIAANLAPQFDFKLDLAENGLHALIIGPTGSGKSQLIKLWLRQLIAAHPTCELWLYDFKGGAGLGGFIHQPQVRKFVTDIDGHDRASVWSAIELELAARAGQLAAVGASRIEDLPAQSMPRLFVLVDELAAALAESVQAHSALTAVVARGRSLGVHFIGASQTLQSIPRAMLANIRARIALGEIDPVDASLLALKRPPETVLAPDGWALGLLQTSGAVGRHFFLPLGPSLGN